MSNENRVLAEFMGITQAMIDYEGLTFADFDYEVSYNKLMRVWAKFRDANVPFEYMAMHELKCNSLEVVGMNSPIEDFYSALVAAVEWYNSTVK